MIPTIPRIYTAIAEWLGCFIYVLIIRKKMNAKTILISLLFLVIQSVWLIWSDTFPLFMWIPSMLIAFAIMFANIAVCARTNFYETGFYCVRAFVIAEFAASIEWQLYRFLSSKLAFMHNNFAELAVVVIIFSIILGLCFYIERKQIQERPVEVNKKEFFLSVIIGIAVFSVSNISFASSDISVQDAYLNEIFYIRSLVDFCGLVLLVSQRQGKRWMQAKFEMDAMQNIIEKQYSQYCQSKDNIELLNQKFHDLKHQIYLIRAEGNYAHIDSYLTEMERGIKKYEAENKTGNAVLDVLLTGKSLVCEKEGINFTCVVDGKLLDFIEVSDLCAMFGNAMDNAIESVGKIEDKEKKIIKLAVFSKDEHIMVRFSNYYENKINYVNDEFLTTKKDENLHGYGLRSIKKCVEKYNGALNINYDNNWFTLYILFDKPEKAQ